MKTYNYTLQYIDDSPYLIPFGQGISDHIPSILLNDTSVTIWNAINTYETNEEIVSHLIKTFQPDNEEEILLLEDDIKQFIKCLERYNVFSNQFFNLLVPYNTKKIHFNIAGISILYTGHEALFSDDFKPFLCKEKQKHAEIIIYTSLMLPCFKSLGTILVRSNDITICENNNEYVFIMNTYQYVKECHILKNCTTCILYHNELQTADYDIAREEVFHTIRFIFLYAAQQHDMYVIHSASILYKNKAWLFSAPSGTGKSTHISLWKNLYNTPCINGDLNLLAITDTSVEVRGIPWCGTSGICDNKTYSLGGIILLKQYSTDIIQPLTQAEKILYTMQRFISPTWTKDMIQKNYNAACFIVKHAMITRLLCTKDLNAAQLIHSEIDKYEETIHGN